MKKINQLLHYCIILNILFLSVILAAPFQAQAANYPLEIINVEETGSNNRIRFAYPGIEYRVRLFAHGGAYPFAWELTANTTCAASINSATGVITWSSPSISDSGCTIEAKVTDSEGNTDSESYTVTVTSSTDRFIWMDASNDGSGRDGSYANPYNNFSDFWNTGEHGGKIAILRSGTYDFSNISGYNYRGRGAYGVTHSDTNHPIAIISYPDESPVWSGTRGFAGTNTGKYWHGGSEDMYFYGIRFTNTYSYTFGVWMTDYSVWHNCIFDDYVSAYGYQNDSNIFWANAGNSSKIGIGGNQFLGGSGSYATALKHYNVHYQVVEGNLFKDYVNDMAISLKHNSTDNVIRGNIFRNNKIDVGFAGYADGVLRNEIAFNFSTGNTYSTIYVNNSGTIGTNHIYRNTLRGSLLFRNMGSGDGPIHLNNNVIVNNDSYSSTTAQIRENAGEHYSITDETAQVSNNLMGQPSNGIVTAEGLLTSSYEQYAGVCGWQFEDGSTPVDGSYTPIAQLLPPPVNLRIIK